MNEINGFPVKAQHAFSALDAARPGKVANGTVGGGTGMLCQEFKGGIGTALRIFAAMAHTVDVLVQGNDGLRRQLRIAGVPAGKEIPEGRVRNQKQGSIIIAIATDAPLLPHQLRMLARRAGMGLARDCGSRKPRRC